MSKNTLSKTLNELKKEKAVHESLRRAAKGGHPVVLYSAAGKALQTVTRIQEIISMFGRFEKLAREHQEIKQKEAPEDRKEIERKSKENYESVKRLALLILAEALLSNFQDSPMNELVGAEALASARKVLWNNVSLRNPDSVKAVMASDRDRILSSHEKDMIRSKRKYSKV